MRTERTCLHGYSWYAASPHTIPSLYIPTQQSPFPSSLPSLYSHILCMSATNSQSHIPYNTKSYDLNNPYAILAKYLLIHSYAHTPPILLLLSVHTYNTANPFYFSLPTLFPAFMHVCYYIHKFPIPYTFYSHIIDMLNKYFVSKYLVNTIPNLTHSYACTLPLLLSMHTIQYTLCSGSSDQFYIVTYYIKRVTTFWTQYNFHTP